MKQVRFDLFDPQTKGKITVEATRAGGEYTALCPKHNDTNPSLAIDPEKKLFYCHGCGFTGGLWDESKARRPRDKMNSEQPDDPPEGQPSPSENVIETYDYCNAHGSLLYQTVKLSAPPPKNKTFRQRRPDGKGGWIWNLNGVPLVPYRLSELLVKDDPVFICEGEKDVDNLRALGLTATTSPMGAGKWRSIFNPYFGGRDVIILPDNDLPGRNHAKQVAKNLQGTAKSIKIAELPGLPEKGDFSDFLCQTTSVTKESFLESVNELAKPWVDERGKTLTLVKGCNIHYPPREPIIKGFPLYKKFVYLISGDQGDYKSILTLHTCRCVVSAQYDLFGKYKVVERGPAIMFDEETPEPIMEERLQGFGLKDDDLPFYLCHFSGLQVDDDEWIEEVLRKIDEVHPVFVGFDSFIDFHTKDENSPKQMHQVMKRLRKIANTGPAVWVISHNSKEAKLTRGTTAIPAAVDMEFFTKVSTKKEVTLEVRKNRVEPFEPIVVVPKFEPTSIRVDYKQTKDQDTWDVIEGLLSNEPISVAGIMQGLEKANVHVEEKTVRNILVNQVSAGLVKTDKIKIDITLADGRVQRRSVEHFWK